MSAKFEGHTPGGTAKNTDVELWREVPGDFYSPRIHVSTDKGIGIVVGGLAIVRPVREWHRLLAQRDGLLKAARYFITQCSCGGVTCRDESYKRIEAAVDACRDGD